MTQNLQIQTARIIYFDFCDFIKEIVGRFFNFPIRMGVRSQTTFNIRFLNLQYRDERRMNDKQKVSGGEDVTNENKATFGMKC